MMQAVETYARRMDRWVLRCLIDQLITEALQVNGPETDGFRHSPVRASAREVILNTLDRLSQENNLGWRWSTIICQAILALWRGSIQTRLTIRVHNNGRKEPSW